MESSDELLRTSSCSPPSTGTRLNSDGEVDVSSHSEKCFFSSATAGYRIVRLTIELFLVKHIIDAGFEVTTAGLVFLVYSLANVVAGLSFLWFPTLWLGTPFRATSFFVISVSLMSFGFIGILVTEALISMTFSGILCGIGTAMWFVNYHTLTTTAFSKENIGQVAQFRQLFECIGFLFPSLCLGVVSSTADSTESILFSTIALCIVAGIFFLTSSGMVIRSASNIQRDTLVRTESVWNAIKTFARSPVSKYFVLNSILLAAANLFFATISVVTETYFGLEATFLWLAAIGFPIGGAISVAFALKRGSQKDDRHDVLVGSFYLAGIFTILTIISPWVANQSPADNEPVAKATLFGVGTILGFFYSGTFTSAFALWLGQLNDQSPDFVARANVLHNVGVQLIIACLFQIQAILIDMVEDKNLSSIVESLILFGPLIILCIVTMAIAYTLPLQEDAKFSWPVRSPFEKRSLRLLMKIAEFWGLGSAEEISFGLFSEFRTGLFGPYLHASTIQRGPEVNPAASLCAEDLKVHLQAFDRLNTPEEWWQSSASLTHVLTSNVASFRKRIELINKAVTSISIITWALDGLAGRSLAEAIIERSKEGVDVHVIFDAVNLFYLEEKRKLGGSTDCLQLLRMLSDAGVKIRMLDKWHNHGSNKPYVIGTHRKIMLVDNGLLFTGGRNIEDEYVRFEGNTHFNFHDLDIVLAGDFSESTGALFTDLWNQSRSVVSVLQGLPPLPLDLGPTEHGDTSSSTSDELMKGEDETDLRIFFRNSSLKSSEHVGRDVTLFQLDHKAGRPDGYDIILSTLLFLLETAQTSIDLIFGYFQLFPCLEETLVRAMDRGVKVRLITNSRETNDCFFLNELFRKTFVHLMEIGVDIYIPDGDKNNFCLHYKTAMIDSRVLLVGSWNSFGISVFYDSEFSVVIFKEDDEEPFGDFDSFFGDSFEDRRFVLMQTAPGPWKLPMLACLATSKYVHRQVDRGY